ncbi:hypothetical protein IG631_20235 [Alternaria alternata]|nr:hypothetical protein IG631_20235 [Alternaria alternata]
MTQPSPPPPANHHGSHNDNHDPIQLDWTVPTHLRPTQMHPDNLHDLYELIAAAKHIVDCCGVYTPRLREALSHELKTAKTRIAEVQGIEEELRQDIVTLRDENAMLKGKDETCEENAARDGGLDAGENVMQVLVEEVSLKKDDIQENDHEAAGRCFEGGWEDMAKFWRDGMPMDHASEPETETRLADANLSNMAYWFERSNAPSPEQRQPRHNDKETLRHIETERSILQLQDRLERTGMQIRHLTNRLDAQETEWKLAVDSIPVLLEAIYDDQEEEEKDDDDDDDDDEPYYTCSDGLDEFEGADENMPLRGGMGGRDEDEEFVYDYGGYTNWDQADLLAQGEVASINDKDEIIQEWRQKVERLEAHRQDLFQSTDSHITAKDGDSKAANIPKRTPSGPILTSIFYQKNKGDININLRGGSDEAEPEGNGSCDHASAEVRSSMSVSPHLLCQRATSRVGDPTIDYIIVYLPPGFIVPGCTKPELVFHSAATIYYFPTGPTEEVVQQEAWKQKVCGDGQWQDVEFHKIQSKQVFKKAIADMWEKMGLGWDTLTRGYWDFGEKDDDGDMYMVNDNNLFLVNRTREVAVPHIRGGAGDEPIQTPWPTDEDDLLDEFKRICDSLMDEARIALMTDSPEQRVQAWMTVAAAAETRNSSVERELETFREMNDSLIQDLQWHIDVQVDLEERLEAAEADKRAMADEYQNLRTLLHHLVVDSDIRVICTCGEETIPAYEDRNRSPGLETIRGGDEEALLQTRPTSDAETRQNASARAPSDSSYSSTVTTANSFVYYPRRSTIVFPDTPLRIYLFPYNSTLPEIHAMLKKGSRREDLRDDPHITCILEIMKIREDMGIYLPEDVSDERITIDIPEILTGCQLDCKTRIIAWHVSNADAGSLEKRIEKLGFESSADKSNDATRTNSTSSEGENDYYQDIGDLVNSFGDPDDTDNAIDWLRSCACQNRPVYGSESYYKIPHPQSSTVSEPAPIVSVRGGGSDPEYWSHTSYSHQKYPLYYPQLTPPSSAPPNTPASYDTIEPPPCRVLKAEEIAIGKVPLSLRLGRFMFPPKFMQQREDDIRRFDWQHIRRLSPQFKDKSSRDFRYTKSAHCEEWAIQLDKHREHCDYCQGVFLEEEYASSDQSLRHEEEAPKPTSGACKPWKKRNMPQKSVAASVTAVVEDLDPRLRGGAGSEADLEYDSEDWPCEWDDLASQTRSADYRPRAFRNSSTLSTETVRSPPSPVDRAVTLRRWRQQADLCTAIEFIGDGPAISKLERMHMNKSEACAGKLLLSPRYVGSDNLTGPKTRHPELLETRAARDGLVQERPFTRSRRLQHGTSMGVFVPEKDSMLDLRAESWLENPRPAPLPPFYRRSASSSQYYQQPHDIGLTKVHEWDCSLRFDAIPRGLSFRSDLHQVFPAGSDFSGNILRIRSQKTFRNPSLSVMRSDEVYGERVSPRPVEEPMPSSPKPRRLLRKIYKQYAALLAMFLTCLNKLKQRLLAKKPRKNASSSSTRAPAAPAPSQMGWEARCMNPGRHPLIFDKSLPPTPHASTSTFDLHPEPKEKFPAALHLEHKEKARAVSWASISTIEHAQHIAQAQDRANGDFVNQEGGEWRVPTVAGPSDLVKEALMWLKYEKESGKMGKPVFEGSMRDDDLYEYARSNDWAVL